VSACKAGCANRNDTNGPLCTWCTDAWHVSPERKRYGFFVYDSPAGRVALTDFCNRTRAERESEKQGTWPPSRGWHMAAPDARRQDIASQRALDAEAMADLKRRMARAVDDVMDGGMVPREASRNRLVDEDSLRAELKRRGWKPARARQRRSRAVKP
jgi:hypothetical protein